jgi:hypothetical protein
MPIADIDPRWLTSSVIDLAVEIETGGNRDKLEYLADALLDAGCDDHRIIKHLTDNHYREWAHEWSYSKGKGIIPCACWISRMIVNMSSHQ